MIPILYRPDADPDALLDANSEPLFDVNSVQLLATGDYHSARTFDSYGLGALTDCISCEVTEERNGEYELFMEYPLDGIHFKDIEARCVIMAKPNYNDSPQAFRIYKIEARLDGGLNIYAQHISYDLSGVPIKSVTATSCSQACSKLISNALIETPFTIGTTVGTLADFKVDEPSSVRSWFGGREGSLLDVYGGEWGYDNYSCTLYSARGTNRGAVIRYGKNLIDLNQETNIAEMYTGVLPFWKNDETNERVETNIINVAGQFDYRKILVLDLSLDFDNKPTQAQLKAKAESYITTNDIGRPKVNITLDWVQVGELTDRVDLCDTVTVIFEKLGIETTAKCISTTWDVLKDRYKEIEIGDAKANMPQTIVGLQDGEKILSTSVTPSMQRAINAATALITGNDGGYVVIRDSDNDGQPDEILIMNTADITTATKVWRWNKNGLGYSSSGYNGPYGLAMTADGEIVADYITTGTLDASQATITNINASNINTGTLTAIAINNGNGSFQVDASGNVTASKVAITGGYLDLDTQNVSQGIKLRNTAGTTYTTHSAATRQRYVNSSLVLGEVNGAITATSFTPTSDGRLKEILPGEIPDLSHIRAVRFRWKDGRDDKEHIGYIAQDVEKVVPDMVFDFEGTKSLDYFQVLTAKIEYLERRLEKLEALDDGR